MFAKLACRNVKRQLSNYLIYFVTVTLTVSMMFALSNLIFSKQLLSYAEKIQEMQGGLIAVAVAVSLVVAFVLGYASAFMLRLRKREFGTYLTLGMKRRDILTMFTVENMLIGLAALGCGILFGLLVYQGMIGLVARVMDLKIALGSYSLSGLGLTVGLTVGTYLLSTASSALYLRKVSVYELLHAEKRVSKKTRHPWLWAAVAVIALAAVVVSIVGAYGAIKEMFLPHDSESALAMRMFGFIALLAVSVVVYHIGLSKSAMSLLLGSRTIKSRGTNTFVLRQLAGQLNANSALCGVIAFLITATVLCTNICLSQKATSETYLDANFPFDVLMDVSAIEESAPYTADEARRMIEGYSPVSGAIPYNIYTSGNGYLHSFTPWTGAEYENLFDSFIRESDFNRVMTALGYPTVELGDRYMILMSDAYMARCDFTGAELTIDGATYTRLDAPCSYPKFAGYYCVAVVPDAAVLSMEVEDEKLALDLESDAFDAQTMYNDLSYAAETEQGYYLERCPVSIRAYYELEENSLTAILIVGELYMAIIFVFLATAILTMKLLSEISGDRRRYDLLYKLGASRSQRSMALLRQTLAMFAFPFLLPLLLSVPAAYVCGQIVSFAGYAALTPQIYMNAAAVAGILVLIQLLYFCATYITKKRGVTE